MYLAWYRSGAGLESADKLLLKSVKKKQYVPLLCGSGPAV